MPPRPACPRRCRPCRRLWPVPAAAAPPARALRAAACRRASGRRAGRARVVCGLVGHWVLPRRGAAAVGGGAPAAGPVRGWRPGHLGASAYLPGGTPPGGAWWRGPLRRRGVVGVAYPRGGRATRLLRRALACRPGPVSPSIAGYWIPGPSGSGACMHKLLRSPRGRRDGHSGPGLENVAAPLMS